MDERVIRVILAMKDKPEAAQAAPSPEAVALGGRKGGVKDLQVNGKGDHQHQRQPKARHRGEDKGKEGHNAV